MPLNLALPDYLEITIHKMIFKIARRRSNLNILFYLPFIPTEVPPAATAAKAYSI